MSEKIEEAVKQMSGKVTMTHKNKNDWLESAVHLNKNIQFNMTKTLIAIAATICLVVFCGFAYRSISETFRKIFIVSSPSFYDLNKAYDEFVYSGKLENLLSKLSPTEIDVIEYKSSVGIIDFTVVKGDTLDRVNYSFNKNTSNHRIHFHDPSKNISYIVHERINKTVEQYAESGEFIAALDTTATGYEFDAIYSMEGKLNSIAYKMTNSIKPMYINFGYANSYWAVEEDATVITEDIEINNKLFMYVENAKYKNSKALFLYLGDDKNISYIEIEVDQSTAKEELLEVAKHLVVYNETANTTKDKTEISEYSDISYEEAKEIIPLPESPFDSYEWFPSNKFNNVEVYKFPDGYITAEFNFSENSNEICKVSISQIFEFYMPVIETKLDALLYEGSDSYDEVIEIRGEYFGIAFDGPFSKNKVLVSTVVEEDGNYYYYELIIAKSFLSGTDPMVWLNDNGIK